MNQLQSSKSNYLQKHASDLVDWQLFNNDTIQKAQELNKPIFLSIGHSSCYWCDVMGEESFKDKELAQVLNDKFVCIKVDRDEYPDIDQYYQTACQLFSKTSGWPLSAFILPDMRPFFVGTYFPKYPKEKEVSFEQLILELSHALENQRDKVETNATQVANAIDKGVQDDQEVEFQGHFPAPSAILEAIDQYADKEHGGYGKAPKFPQLAFYEWACEQMLEGMIDKKYGEHIIKTLENIFTGGVFDQARGGIHRFSSDDKWLVPHFEKMLYDQAGVLKLLSKLCLLYPSPLFYDHLYNTLIYLEKEMLSESSFLFSSQAADSEGIEGLYFCFTNDEFDLLVSKALANTEYEKDLDQWRDKIKNWFNIKEEGQFQRGLNVISLNMNKKEEIFNEEGLKIIRMMRESILEERKNRIPPHTDNKGIASWNFMILSSLVDVMQYCRIEGIRKQASKLFNQLLKGSFDNFVLQKKDSETQEATQSTLMHCTSLNHSIAYFEDYVFFAEAQLRIYELTGNSTFKDNVIQLLNLIEKQFFKNNHPFVRALNLPFEVKQPNQEVSLFDTSYRSPAATFVQIIRRSRVLLKDQKLLESLDPFIETLTHRSLKNPIASGEALRALSYPDNAYRVVEVPRKWLQNDQFLNFIPYFLSRFIFDYHDHDHEKWNISSIEKSELEGEGIESFIDSLAPKKKDQK